MAQSLDSIDAPAGAVALKTRETALATLLAKHPDAIVAAFADDGTRIALPESFALGHHQALAVPPERETMLNLIVPGDRMAVVAAWERTRRYGISVVTVHPLSDPGAPLTLTMLDGRERYGAWLGVLTPDGEQPDELGALEAGPLAIPSRPRRATMRKSYTAIITEIDDNVTRMLGWAPDQMVGLRSTEFIHPDDHDRAVASWMQLVSSTDSQRVRVRHRCADGSWLWVEVEHIYHHHDSSDAVDVLVNLSDISDEMAAHEEVRRREQLFSRLAESLPTGVLQLGHDGAAVYANARIGSILHTGRPASAAELVAAVAPADRATVQGAIDAALQRGADEDLEVEVVAPQAHSARRCALTIASVSDQDGRAGALICVDDVTESARLREELRMQATHDALTGCLNRAAIIRTLGQLMVAQAGTVAVVFVDVDNFKPINDRLGHAAGDELLIHLARRLQGLCRGTDFVGRLGGDEFLLVCRDVALPAQTSLIANRVRQALNQPVALAAGTVELQASIGMAWAEGDTTAEDLIARADTAMYEGKRRSRAA